MNIQEATKVISEYMGVIKPYAESLDALVPVWKKLKSNDVWINKLENRDWNRLFFYCHKPQEKYSPFDPFNFVEESGNNIYEVCCIATAKAIKELVK